jgi:hypothetical protein
MFSTSVWAALYILMKSGVRVVLPPASLCCGFPLHANAKVKVHDRIVLADTILFSQIREMFSYLDFDAVVVSCGTCREALLEMGADPIFQAPLYDVSRFALENGLPTPRRRDLPLPPALPRFFGGKSRDDPGQERFEAHPSSPLLFRSGHPVPQPTRYRVQNGGTQSGSPGGGLEESRSAPLRPHQLSVLPPRVRQASLFGHQSATYRRGAG